jgi:ATP-dependent DNA helicase RecG
MISPGTQPSQNHNQLEQPVQYVKGVGPKRAELLERLEIYTIRDLLFYFPRDYQDRRNIISISNMQPGEYATVIGIVRAVNESRPYRRGSRVRHILKVAVSDDTGILHLVWFNQPYRKKQFQIGDTYIFSGKVSTQTLTKEMNTPDFEKIGAEPDQYVHTQRIIPIYPLSEQIDQRWLRSLLSETVEKYAAQVPEVLPQLLIDRYKWISRAEAIQEIHFPTTPENLIQAKQRLIYDELFLMQVLLVGQKAKSQHEAKPQQYQANQEVISQFLTRLPFKLTYAQQKVIREIQEDLNKPAPMNRLLQGDVGSGKTVVAVIAMLTAIANGYQAAIMAPTEILAQQHYATLNALLQDSGLDIEIILLIGGMKLSRKKSALERIQANPRSIIIGTHALIQERVQFSRLSFVTIDEQHRFGVMQRHLLRRKGWLPDVLVMTATPIPRTLAMTVYSDLDVSVLDEMPPGRLPINTQWFTDADRDTLYTFLQQELHSGRQVYLIYPLIEESDKMELRAAIQMYQHLQRDIFPQFTLGLLHGRMKEPEKQRIMAAFVSGKIQLLVSTTVVEVGVDVANAAVMVVEHADRFGLAQLHQLRGRVGRGTQQSYCILVTEKNITEAAQARMKIMTATTDGFKIAEEDLKWRGPGELVGTAQHGIPVLRLADLIRDFNLLQQAKNDAMAIIAADPQLLLPEHHQLRLEMLRFKHTGRTDLVKVA